ncbi:MAG: rhodanese-like domain-containing protein [Pseudomonadota bacterium]
MPAGKKFLLRMIGQTAAIVLAAVILGLTVNHVRPDGLSLVGDWSPEARITSAAGDSLIIPFEEAKGQHDSGRALFLDARSEVWFEMGHIKGAKNLPPNQIDRLFPQVLGDTPKDRLIVAYCDGEHCELSRDLALALLERGFTKVRVLVNGWTLWREAGLPVEEKRP